MENAFSPAAIAARVAKRYAHIPSYREMLAATASSTVDSIVEAAATQDQPSPPAPEPHPEPVQQDLLRYSVSTDSLPAAPVTPVQAHAEARKVPLAQVLDPIQEATVEPPHPLPARIIEAPIELVAPRKARPRLAEGPLRLDNRVSPAPTPESDAHGSEPSAVPSPASPAPESTSNSTPARTATPSRPQWLSIQLDTETPIRPETSSPASLQHPLLHVAPFEDRAMAALVDLGLVASSFLLFVVVFAFSSTSLPTNRTALVGACLILFAMGLLYQFLFFTLTDATPGMRYARIALCTFDDENPTPPARRARIAALLLSALPLGLGFLWAVFDEDSLGWHDRITRTYQRSYREL
jgi:uncharacterized RDD family membrane protein YckC